MDSRTPEDVLGAADVARKRDGVGSSGGRVSAALKRAQELSNKAASPADEDADDREFARLEQTHRARKEREQMFERQARALEALLGE
jgi:hypothetical protein